MKEDLASYDREFAPDWVLNCIDNAPTLEVRYNKPKQGEWIFDGWGTYCSACGYRPKIGCGKFCSECGADMRNTAKPTKEVIDKLGECKCNTCKHNGTWACNNCHCFDKYERRCG